MKKTTNNANPPKIRRYEKFSANQAASVERKTDLTFHDPSSEQKYHQNKMLTLFLSPQLDLLTIPIFKLNIEYLTIRVIYY